MRQAPILGATGLDFGAKPAISFVLPKKRQARIIDEDENLCPPVGAPISLYATLNLSGEVLGCTWIDFITEGDVTSDLVPWLLTEDGCVSTDIGSSTTIAYSCDACPGYETPDRTVSMFFRLIWSGFSWIISIRMGLDGNLCDGVIADLTHNEDIGAGDPVGTHSFVYTDDAITWTIDVTIS